MEFNDLSEEQKIMVRKHYKICMKDKSMECRKEHRNINEFWVAHQEEDFFDFLNKRS